MQASTAPIPRPSGSNGETRSAPEPRSATIMDRFAHHWPEYAIEGALLGVFMISACSFSVLLFHPDAWARRAVPAVFPRMVLMGLAMGLTALGIFYSPWGKRSGAHMNPAVTLTFLRMGRVQSIDASFYMIGQVIGGTLGVLLCYAVWGNRLADPAVNFAVTLPMMGIPLSLAVEFAISFLMMATVLAVSNSRLSAFTPCFAAALVALYVTFESPLTGFSINPARTVASAVVANVWTGAWIYFAGPIFGMLLAAEAYLATRHYKACAKFHHNNDERCIFCEHQFFKQFSKAIAE